MPLPDVQRAAGPGGVQPHLPVLLLEVVDQRACGTTASTGRRCDVEGYYAFARERGATRLVITGGGEPLLRADDVVQLVERGRPFFDEIACFTNGTYLTPALARRLADAGLSYLCYSRHARRRREVPRADGADRPALAPFFRAAAGR